MKRNKLNKYINIGLVLIIIPILLIMFSSIFMNLDISGTDVVNRLDSPSLKHLMGTDELGRDVFSRVIVGMRNSIFIGFNVTVISLLIGLTVGIASAYHPLADNILMRLVDIIMAFPTIIVAITLAGILGSGMENIIIALAISYIPTVSRTIKNAVIDVKDNEYIQAVVVIGKSDLYIITRCVLPNIMSELLVQTTYVFAMAILNEAILSFLGVGIKPPMPSLGGMVSDARNYFTVAPWLVILPSITISWIVLSLNMIGDGLRGIYNPKNN